MPIYEYSCTDCGKVFEEIVFGERDSIPCPYCKGTHTRKLISRCRTRMGGEIPTAKSEAGLGDAGGCSSCGGGSCGTCG